MARLQPVEPHGLDLLRRITFRWAKKMYGRPMEPTQVIAHHRPLMVGVGVISLAAERKSTLDSGLRHLAMLRTAQLIGCEWCLDFGSWLAQQAGRPEEQLRELSSWRDSARFDERERLVLEYAEAITRTPVEVSDQLFERVRRHFDERQIVELTMAISLENMYSRTNWALGIEGEGFAEGMYCVPPQAAREPALAGTAEQR